MEGMGGATARDTEVRLPRATAVKNKQPADRQVGHSVTPTYSCTMVTWLCSYSLLGQTL